MMYTLKQTEVQSKPGAGKDVPKSKNMLTRAARAPYLFEGEYSSSRVNLQRLRNYGQGSMW